MHLLTAIPVYNEEASLVGVLTEVLKYAGDVLVVDDGSTDRTPVLLRDFPTVRTIRHPRNLGYGAGLRTAFQATIDGGYDGVVTLDCDGQHEPARIPELACSSGGGRYCLRQPLLASVRPCAKASRATPADQRRGHTVAQRMPGDESDGRILRLQGLSNLRAASCSTSPTMATRCLWSCGCRPSLMG